jgi:competence protein ComEA
MATFPLGVQSRRVLAAALLALVLVVVAWRHAAAGSTAPLRVAPVVPARASPAAAGAARLLVVDVVGAVHRPGLVRLPEGSRVADAIARAGGLRRGAERAGVNFAAPVSDGQQVVVPQHGAAVAGGSGAGAASAATGPVSLSSATAEQLDTLPGVGPATAEKIIAYRQQHGAFRSVDELDAISGIGPSRIADLRGLVVP